MKDYWREMDTAPLDGTEVLITGGTFENDQSMGGPFIFRGVTIAVYKEVPWSNERAWRGDNAGGHDEYYWHKPDYWMPLPKPRIKL